MSNIIVPRRSLILPSRFRQKQGGFIMNPFVHTAGPSSFASTVAADNPTAWWRLAETSGTTAVNIGSTGINGTYTGGYTLAQTSIIGDAGDAAVTLNGTSGYIPAGTSAQLIYSAFTWMAVLRTPATLGQRAIFSHGEGGLCVRTEATGKLHVIKSHIASRGESTAALSANTDYIIHVTRAASGGTTKIYINGAYDSTVTPETTYNGAHPFMIGVDRSTSGTFTTWWSGKIDEVAIFDSELSAARALAHAEAAGLA